MKISTIKQLVRQGARRNQQSVNSNNFINNDNDDDTIMMEKDQIMAQDTNSSHQHKFISSTFHNQRKKNSRKEKAITLIKNSNKLYGDLWFYISEFMDESLKYFLSEFRLICKQTLDAASRFTKLEMNGIYGNRLFSLICNHMKDLRELKLEKRLLTNRKKAGIIDINPLKKGILSKLEYLNLNNNSIANVSAFGFANNMENLKYLNLKRNKLTKWEHLTNKKLRNLEYLNLNSNMITEVFVKKVSEEIIPPESFSNLKTLKLGYNKLTILPFINNKQYFSHLTNLDLKFNEEIDSLWFSDLKLENLEQLNISGTRVTRISNLLNNCFPNLKILKYGSVKYDNNTSMKEILDQLSPYVDQSIRLINKIETLYLNNMNMTYANIIQLSTLKLFQQQLTKLVLSENRIYNSSIEVLAQVPNQLTCLTLSNCSLDDGCVPHFHSFSKLKSLNVAWNHIRTNGCVSLMGMHLDYLDIFSNNSIDEKIISTRKTNVKRIKYGWGRINIQERVL